MKCVGKVVGFEEHEEGSLVIATINGEDTHLFARNCYVIENISNYIAFEKYGIKDRVSNFGELRHPTREDYLNFDDDEEDEITNPCKEIDLDPIALDHIQYEERPFRSAPKVLTRIKRFVFVKDEIDLRHQGLHKEGDIFEEGFNKPNEFWNVSLMQRSAKKNSSYSTSISRINYFNREPANQWFNALEPIEDIDAKDSWYFQQNIKKAASQYRNKMRKIALLNEETTNLKYLLDINEDE